MSQHDHERLARVKEQANGFTTKDLVLLLREDIKELRNDHEPRIRSLEGSVNKWRAAIPGVSVLGLAVALTSFILSH